MYVILWDVVAPPWGAPPYDGRPCMLYLIWDVPINVCCVSGGALLYVVIWGVATVGDAPLGGSRWAPLYVVYVGALVYGVR